MIRGVALIYPYFQTASSHQMLFQPLGIGLVAAQLKLRGIPVQKYDCTFKSFDEIVDAVTAQNPFIVGIYVMTTLSRNADRLLNSLKERLPDAIFTAGGPLPSLYAERFGEAYDLVFRGDSSVSFTTFCTDYLALGNRKSWMCSLNPDRYPGVYARSNQLEWDMPIGNNVGTAADLPVITDRSGADHAKYQDFWIKRTGNKPATLMTTYGCPFHCDFCSKPVFGHILRQRDLELIMAEIRDIQSYHYDQLWIADDCFTLDPDFVQRFCDRMILEDLGFTWTCLSRVDHLSLPLVQTMKQAGCVQVYLGLESGCNETLQLMNKRATVQMGQTAIRLFQEAGIKTAGFFIVGYPGETIDSVQSTFNFALHSGLDEISFNVPYPLPGSALFERMKGQMSLDQDWHEENEIKFLYGSEFDENWLKGRIDETFQMFQRRKSVQAWR